MTAWCCV